VPPYAPDPLVLWALNWPLKGHFRVLLIFYFNGPPPPRKFWQKKKPRGRATRLAIWRPWSPPGGVAWSKQARRAKATGFFQRPSTYNAPNNRAGLPIRDLPAPKSLPRRGQGPSGPAQASSSVQAHFFRPGDSVLRPKPEPDATHGRAKIPSDALERNKVAGKGPARSPAPYPSRSSSLCPRYLRRGGLADRATIILPRSWGNRFFCAGRSAAARFFGGSASPPPPVPRPRGAIPRDRAFFVRGIGLPSCAIWRPPETFRFLTSAGEFRHSGPVPIGSTKSPRPPPGAIHEGLLLLALLG